MHVETICRTVSRSPPHAPVRRVCCGVGAPCLYNVKQVGWTDPMHLQYSHPSAPRRQVVLAEETARPVAVECVYLVMSPSHECGATLRLWLRSDVTTSGSLWLVGDEDNAADEGADASNKTDDIGDIDFGDPPAKLVVKEST
jgi:hypothetical protein